MAASSTETQDSVKFAKQYREASALFQTPDGLQLIEQLCPAQGSKVLDLGCGTGELTVALAERVGSEGHVVGIDPDKERLKIAKEKNTKPNITYVEADGETFPEDQYDLVFANYVLHWIKNKEAVFERVSQNTRPGGQFAFIIGYSEIPIAVELSMLMGEEMGKKIIESFFLSLPEEYERLAQAHGFTITSVEKDTQILQLPTFQNALDLWSGITKGMFNPASVDQGELEKIRQKYGSENLKLEKPNARFILTKQ